ncbi:uridylate-specific endoribonuclease-like [Ptychodera flava]|uniref:uridylate-specific endoribonuclease-like n=1 Tax=Ptychodera flava TaxID=63121 RepID=UPI00396A3B4F
MKLSALLVLIVVSSHSLLAQDSCINRCGLNFDSSYSCQCNDGCVNYGDCCADYDSLCQGSSDSCQGRCGEQYDRTNPCHCNDLCGQYGNCCSDYTSECDSSNSCKGRCGEQYDKTNPCHCNDLCSQYGNCCNDYGAECGSPGLDGLSELVNNMWSSDVNAADDGDISLNVQGLITDTSDKTDRAPGKLFTYFNEAVLNKASYKAMVDLFDNYIRATGTSESDSFSEKSEIESFLDEVMNSKVMILAHDYLSGKGLASSNINAFREEVKSMWFTHYSRTTSSDSSGFEHVFVGEVKNGAVSGFHNWIQLYLQESSGNLDYHGYIEQQDNGVLSMQFQWDGYHKSITSVFMKRSPEFEMALFTVCFLEFPDSLCRFDLNGSQVSVQTWTMYSDYVGSAYVM